MNVSGCSVASGLMGVTDFSQFCLHLKVDAQLGENCVDHLRTDFCFALGNEVHQIPFCAAISWRQDNVFWGRVNDSYFVSNSPDVVACCWALADGSRRHLVWRIF